MFDDSHLKNDLAHLKSNFFSRKEAITNLKKRTLTFDEGLKMILGVKDKLFNCNGIVAELVKTKMDLVLKKNMGFKTLLQICSIINGLYEWQEDEDVNTSLIPGRHLNMFQ